MFIQLVFENDKELISDFDCTLNDGLDEYDYDAAFAEHNAHEEGFSIDGGFDGKPNKALKLADKEFKKVTKKNKKK